MNEIVKRNQEVVDEYIEEVEEQEFNEEEVREGNVDEGDEVVLENKYKGKVRYEDSGQST